MDRIAHDLSVRHFSTYQRCCSACTPTFWDVYKLRAGVLAREEGFVMSSYFWIALF